MQQTSQVIDRSPSQIGLLACLVAELFEFSAPHGPQAVGESGSGTVLPRANDQHNQAESEEQSREGNDVRGPVETFGDRSSQNCWAIFLDEALLDQAVAVAA